MSVQAINELRESHRYVSAKVTAEATHLTPEEVLDEWRQLHPSQEAFDEDLAAIQEALDDVDKGNRGMLFEQFDIEFRKRHNIPA